MIIIDILHYSLVAILALVMGYQLLLSILALFSKNRDDFKTEKNRKFALVIPAHNEEKMIAKTIYSLNNLIYPKRLYDIIVVADNCSDDTATIARKLETRVLERNNQEHQGKGYALRWIFDKILTSSENYDSIVVIDSDSLISGNYLKVMNYYLENGSRVIQSTDVVLPQPGNWSIETTRIGFLLYNYVKPLGRKILNFNMLLRGNGMCFSADLLREIPWQAWSLTEDAEFGLILILKGVKIDFAPEAVVWAQMPVQASNAESQRARWERGRLQLTKRYAFKFLKKTFKNVSLKSFDVFIDLITPPFVNTMFVVLSILIVHLILWYFALSNVINVLIWSGLFLAGILYLFIGLYAAKADRNVYKSLIYIPVFVYWKIKLTAKQFRSNQQLNWIRTTRDN